MKAVPLIGIARHRLTIDGEGVTTLVAFHGCPLRCKYCLNPTSLQPDGVWESYDCNQLYEEVRKDELYFLARNSLLPSQSLLLGLLSVGCLPIVRTWCLFVFFCSR